MVAMTTELGPDDFDLDDIDAHRFDVWVTINRDGEHNLLRSFKAGIGIAEPLGDELVEIGSCSGWFARRGDMDLLVDAADSIDQECYELGCAAARIIDAHSEGFLDTALLLNRMTLAEHWRGHKLTGPIVRNLVDLLQLEPVMTVAVTLPEPVGLDGSGPLEDGPLRDAGMAKLHASCRAAGFEPSDGRRVWWRGFGGEEN